MSDVIDIVLGDKESSNIVAQVTSLRVPAVGEVFSRKGVEYRIHRVEWIEVRDAHHGARLGPIVYVEEVT